MESQALLTEFETEVCGRCGGSGRYSWNAMHGSICYGCRGKGKRLTKRGAAAYNLYQSLLEVPLGSLKVGDTMQCSYISTYWFAKIVEISEPHVYAKSLQPDGTYADVIGITVKTAPSGKHPASGLVAPPENMVRKGWTAEEKKAARDKALAFQATLTKTGKPRKAAA